MSATAQRRRRGDRHAEEHVDERWLLTYSDMITLLMALFIVMWAISSTNTTKFKELKQSLNQAFSGKIIAGNHDVLTGGAQIMEQGSEGRQGSGAAFFSPETAIKRTFEKAAQKRDLENLQHIRSTLMTYAKTHGFQHLISTKIDERGLVIRLLTDEVLFAPGHADLQWASLPLIDKISQVLNTGGVANPIRVEGNTDDTPISTSEFRSNWELSTARAAAVLQVLLHNGVQPRRLSVAGYADQRPIATNTTPAGRGKNRRVELVVLRRSTSGGIR